MAAQPKTKQERPDRGKTPQHAPKGPGPANGGGGKSRSVAETRDLIDEAERLMLYGVGRVKMSRLLGGHIERQAAEAEGRIPNPDPEPMPLGTVDDYIRRVKDRWASESLPDPQEARKQQVRRLFDQIQILTAAGRHSEVEKRERLLARLQGTELASKVELSGPGGAPLPTPADTVKVVVYAPNAGRVTDGSDGGAS